MNLKNLCGYYGLILSATSLFTNYALDASQFLISLPSGEERFLELNERGNFFDLLNEAAEISENENGKETDRYTIHLDLKEKKGVLLKDFQAGQLQVKNYETKVTKKEKEDIAYIVTTLGRSSLKKIWDAESLIKKAGDRVDHLHPLKFIGCIFSDEELKVSLIQIKQRGGIVARKFFNGIYDGLSGQASIHNLKREMVVDFANSLKVDPNPIVKLIEAKKWKELITKLIDLLPRNGNPNKYDM